MKFRILAAATASLALAACGSADDASTEAEADTVDIAADEALEEVTEEPVADASANDVSETAAAAEAAEAASIEEAADNAADAGNTAIQQGQERSGQADQQTAGQCRPGAKG